MINWTLLSPRNFFVIAVMAVIAIWIFQHFTKDSDSAAAA